MYIISSSLSLAINELLKHYLTGNPAHVAYESIKTHLIITKDLTLVTITWLEYQNHPTHTIYQYFKGPVTPSYRPSPKANTNKPNTQINHLVPAAPQPESLLMFPPNL